MRIHVNCIGTVIFGRGPARSLSPLRGPASACAGRATGRSTGRLGGFSVLRRRTRAQAAGSVLVRGHGPGGPGLLGADPPHHDRGRAIVSRAVAPRRILALTARADAVAARLVARMTGDGAADIVAGLAEPLPIELIGALLGVDRSSLPEFKRWSRAVVAIGTGRHAGAEATDLVASVEELERLSAELRGRRLRPRDDVISALVAGGPDQLDPQEALSVAKLLLVAGSETTANLIANAMYLLLRDPAMLARAQRDPQLVPAVLEETLRYESPVQFVYRVARRDVQLADRAVPAGTVVIAVVGSANRDASQFEDADAFRPGRRAQGQLAFGAGPHACLGSLLARIEAKAALGALLSLSAMLEPAEDLGTVLWRPSMQLRGPERLRVTLRQAARAPTDSVAD